QESVARWLGLPPTNASCLRLLRPADPNASEPPPRGSTVLGSAAEWTGLLPAGAHSPRFSAAPNASRAPPRGSLVRGSVPIHGSIPVRGSTLDHALLLVRESAP